MTTSSPPNSDEPTNPDAKPARVNLARLREQAGLSLDDMSKRLKLNQDLLQRLERGETEFLGAPAYIRGYLKNYAKVLGVPESEIMQGYPVPEEKLPRINTQYAIANVAPRRRSSGHFLGYLLGTLVVAAFAYGIWYMMSQGRAGRGLNVEIGPLAESKGKSGTNSESDFHYSSLLPPPPATGNEAGNENDDVSGQGGDESPNELNPDPPQAEGSAEEGASPRQETGGQGTADRQTTNTQDPVLTGSRAVEAATAMTEVVLVLDEPAWVSLRQADGTRLEHDLLQAGEYRYTSSMPVHFRLGNARQVRVQVNGQQLPLADHINKDVADFDWPQTQGQLATN